MEDLIIITIIICSSELTTSVCTVSSCEIKSSFVRFVLHIYGINWIRFGIPGSCKALEELPSRISW